MNGFDARTAFAKRRSLIKAAMAMAADPQNPLRFVRADSDEASAIRGAFDMTIKTAVAPMQTTDNGGAAVPRANLDYLGGLTDPVALDRIRPQTMPLPREHVRFAVQGAVGYGSTVSEAIPKPFMALDFDVVSDTHYKAVGSCVITREVAKLSNGERIIDAVLTGAVAVASDAPFISFLVNGAPTVVSSGTDAAAVIQDVARAISASRGRVNSRRFLIVPAWMEEQLLLMPAGSGNALLPFADGSIGPVTIVGSDAMEIDTTTGADVVLLDAAKLATFTSDIAVRAAESATVEMNDTSANPVDATTVMRSLFQSDLMALQAERWISLAKLRPDAAVVIQGAMYSAA